MTRSMRLDKCTPMQLNQVDEVIALHDVQDLKEGVVYTVSGIIDQWNILVQGSGYKYATSHFGIHSLR